MDPIEQSLQIIGDQKGSGKVQAQEGRQSDDWRRDKAETEVPGWASSPGGIGTSSGGCCKFSDTLSLNIAFVKGRVWAPLLFSPSSVLAFCGYYHNDPGAPRRIILCPLFPPKQTSKKKSFNYRENVLFAESLTHQGHEKSVVNAKHLYVFYSVKHSLRGGGGSSVGRVLPQHPWPWVLFPAIKKKSSLRHNINLFNLHSKL